MRLTRKFLKTAGAMSMVGVVGLGFATPAFADTNTWPIEYHSVPVATKIGTATVVRAANVVDVKIAMTATNTFTSTSPNLIICASTSPFTTKVNPSSCSTSGGTPNGDLMQYTESGATANVSFTLPAAFDNVAAYLQIHLNTLDCDVANTSMVNPPNDNTPLYGNVATDPLPIAAAGALGLAGALGGVLFFLQRRRPAASVA